MARVVRANDAQCIRLNHEFTSLTQDDSGVEAVFVNGTRERAELLIGADGIRSNVRLALGLSLPPRYTGLVAWRGLVPTESLPPRLRSTSTTSWIGSERHIIEYTVGHLKN
ncbi:FAD-dependent monooxygenase, partial [Salmonella enterica]|uniref:FAD-dependent monooxygenase n=1 Tax=Salmonella enterica TaxID=28901 RepID=UPI0032982C51